MLAVTLFGVSSPLFETVSWAVYDPGAAYACVTEQVGVVTVCVLPSPKLKT